MEIGDADRGDTTLFLQCHECLPHIDAHVERRRRPMDQVQIDRIESEATEALVEGAQRLVINPGCCSTAWWSDGSRCGRCRIRDRLADRGFVTVDRRSVDQAIAQSQSHGWSGACLVIGDLPDSEAELTNIRGVGQSTLGNLGDGERGYDGNRFGYRNFRNRPQSHRRFQRLATRVRMCGPFLLRFPRLMELDRETATS